jgi:SAM-dependent methyltransferase
MSDLPFAVAQYDARGVNPDRLAAVRTHAGRRVLDAGCGNGQYVRLLHDEYDIHGFDYKPFEAWAERPDRFRVATVTDLPYDDGDFDTVTSFEVLEHIPDAALALREFHRVARRNIIVTVPNCDIPDGLSSSRLTFYHYTDPTHCNFFTMSSFTQAIRDAGFSIDRAHLINPINVLPFLSETLALPRLLLKAVSRYCVRQRHFMTCLVVASKTPAAGFSATALVPEGVAPTVATAPEAR